MAPYEILLEREPENKYDPRAIQVAVIQEHKNLLT
jgi:hypothetical protein